MINIIASPYSYEVMLWYPFLYENMEKKHVLGDKLEFIWMFDMLAKCIDNDYLPNLKIVKASITYNSSQTQRINML